MAQSSSITNEERKDNKVFQALKWIFENFDFSKRETSEGFDQEQQWMLFSDFYCYLQKRKLKKMC